MAESYRMVKLLGEGSFGKCYLVESQNTGKPHVIKQIDIRAMTQEEKDDTIKEALILRRLDHPNIVHFHDAYLTKRGKLCIVMDHADGGDLHMLIKGASGHLEETEILDLFLQICLGLKHIHNRKILHRDLKSQNIFLTSSGMVKLGDFGIAKVLNKTSDNARTMVGTPYYLSPEIIEGRPYNFKSDIWSLGVLLYEMCCLKPPFDGNSLHFLALKIVRGSYPPIPKVYSRELKSLLSRMLSVDPKKRPTIKKILSEPLIRSRIVEFMEPEEYEVYGVELPQKANRDEERKLMLEDIRRKKEEFKGKSVNFEFVGESELMKYEMQQALIEEDGDVNYETFDISETYNDVPPPRDEEIDDNDEEPTEEPLPEVNSFDKIEALRVYIENSLGYDVFVEAYMIAQNMESEDYDAHFTLLKDLLTEEQINEFLPLIEALIEMEKL